MRKVLLIILMFLLCSSFAYAQDVVTLAPAIGGSVMYDLEAGAIVPVVDLQLVKVYDGLIELRGLAVGDKDLTNIGKIGVGVGVNLVVLTNKLGQEWVAKVINPTVGVAPLYSFDNKKVSFGIYATIVKIEF